MGDHQAWDDLRSKTFKALPVGFRSLLPYFCGRGDRLTAFLFMLLAADKETSQVMWSQQSAATALGMAPRNMTRLVKDLIHLGFITPCKNPLKSAAASYVVFSLAEICDHLLGLRDPYDGRLLTIKAGKHCRLELDEKPYAKLQEVLLQNGYWASLIWLGRTSEKWRVALAETETAQNVIQAIEERLLLARKPPRKGRAGEFVFILRPGQRLGKQVYRAMKLQADKIADALSQHLGYHVAYSGDVFNTPPWLPRELNGVLLQWIDHERKGQEAWWRWEGIE